MNSQNTATETDRGYANHAAYSDVNPFEVVRKVSDKTLEIRSMKSVLDPDWKPEITPGGFAGHCSNSRSQKWIITSDSEGKVVRIRLRKNGHWKNAGGSRFVLCDHPVKYHDYNF